MLDTLYGDQEIQMPNNITFQPQEQVTNSFVKQCQNSETKIESASSKSIPSSPVDTRPRLTDGHGSKYLIDSGSMACVLKAGPDDHAENF